MGQSYKAVNLDTEEYLDPYNVGRNGSKLLEHSYRENDFVGTVLYLLSNKWKGNRIAWIGDYYEAGENPKVQVDWHSLELYKEKFIIRPKETITGFLNNLDKEVSINLEKAKAYESIPHQEGWELSPLPLLTACGNDRGGGDYRKQDYLYYLIETWAGDRLSYTPKRPKFKNDFTDLFNGETNTQKYLKELTQRLKTA